MKPIEGHTGNRPKIIIQKRYTLFYILNVLFGARKQIFITFGPWVLIKVFGEPVSTIAWLNVIASILGMFFSPQIGKLIDRFGERGVLMADAALLIGVCLGYGFADQMGLGRFALDLIYISFVLDQVLFSVGIARTTYVSKIAAKKEDVTATLSLGVTVDHVISMSIPTLGGLIWAIYGYQYVFIGAAIVACLTLIATGFITIPPPKTENQIETEAAG
jgi:predicted MFS family arabinose efflux permease